MSTTWCEVYDRDGTALAVESSASGVKFVVEYGDTLIKFWVTEESWQKIYSAIKTCRDWEDIG